jgi:hypothetical protein
MLSCGTAWDWEGTDLVAETAVLDVRVLPWRPRARVMKASTLREGLSNFDPLGGADDLHGFVLGLAAWLAIIVAAPVVVLVLAAVLFSVELPIVVAVAALLVVIRFTGFVPWEVLVIDPVSGRERRERHRSLLRAAKAVRGINGDRRVRVRWAWS